MRRRHNGVVASTYHWYQWYDPFTTEGGGPSTTVGGPFTFLPFLTSLASFLSCSSSPLPWTEYGPAAATQYKLFKIIKNAQKIFWTLLLSYHSCPSGLTLDLIGGGGARGPHHCFFVRWLLSYLSMGLGGGGFNAASPWWRRRTTVMSTKQKPLLLLWGGD